MKKTLFILAAVLAFGIAECQTNTGEVQLFQSIFGAEKRAIMEQFIKLDGPANATFWGLYAQFEEQRKDLGLTRIDLLKTYAENYATLDDMKTNAIMKDMMDLQKKNDDLLVTYYKRINKAVGAKPAAQFYQLESYFLSSIRSAILEEIPFIGELDENQKN
jgi:hypothetical protein